MNFWDEHRGQFNRWVAEAEANHHAVSRRQLELDERKRELDNLEAVVRKRERDVEEAEAAAQAAKLAEAEKMKAAVQKPVAKKLLLDVLNTDEKVVTYLMKKKVPIIVIPDSPYGTLDVGDIKKHGLRLTTDFRESSFNKTTLRFMIGSSHYMLRVAWITYHAAGGTVAMRLTPGDVDWNFFTIESMSSTSQYPMPKTIMKLVEETSKVTAPHCK